MLNGVKELEALGMLQRWILFIQGHSENGRTRLNRKMFDQLMCNKKGACKLFEEIGWIEIDEDGCVRALNFEKYNDATETIRDKWAEQKRKYRAKNKAANEPLPPACPPECPADMSAGLVHTQDNTRQDSPPVRELPPPDASAPPPAAPRGVALLPRNADEVVHHAMNDATLPMDAETRQRCAMDFFETMEACGWIDTRHRPVTDWRPAFRVYARRYAANLNRATTAVPGGTRTNIRNENSNKNHVDEY